MTSRYCLIILSMILVLSGCQTSVQTAGNKQQGNSLTGSLTTRAQATFPAQQRPPGDPAVIARGRDLYGINCRSCHGFDLRGGDLGGPNLLRSETVLNDGAGELITLVVLEGRSNPGMPEMPPLALPDEDITAIAEYIHSVVATSERQGAPPAGPEQDLNIVTGDVDAGRHYFDAVCSSCHSVNGDLKGIASKVPGPENLQNSWVAGRRWGIPDPEADPARRQVRVIVTLDDGESISGRLGRRDDFMISLTADDGSFHSFTLHDSTAPGVASISILDPLQRHRELLSEYTDEIMHNVTAYLVTLK